MATHATTRAGGGAGSAVLREKRVATRSRMGGCNVTLINPDSARQEGWQQRFSATKRGGGIDAGRGAARRRVGRYLRPSDAAAPTSG
jgi:hypothetical protein